MLRLNKDVIYMAETTLLFSRSERSVYACTYSCPLFYSCAISLVWPYG